MNRLLIESSELDDQGRVLLAGARARHLVKVLAASPGKPIRAGVIDGPAGEAVVESVEDERVQLRFEAQGPTPARPRMDLLLAAPRPKVMKRLWAQIAALGVDRILIAGAAKVEPYYFDSHAYTPEVWRPRLLEGLAQCGGTLLPRVHVAKRLRPLIENGLTDLSDADSKLILHPGEPDLLISTPHLAKAQRVLLAMGPEGGWTDDELALMDSHGFLRVGLGMRVLRTDTACIGALSITAQRLEALA